MAGGQRVAARARDTSWSIAHGSVSAATDHLPPYSSATVRVTLQDPGGVAKCGECVLGLAKSVGDIEYGATLGIKDYSRKDVDAFGNTLIVERAYSKRATFTVWITSSLTGVLQNLLAGYRATPVVYIGSDLRAETLVYGFYRDFSIVIRYANESVCNIEIEGLT